VIDQLPLNITLGESASFDSFVQGDNGQALSSIRDCAAGQGEKFLYLWGTKGTGRSHLLQAACRFGAQSGQAVSYLPLAEIDSFTPDILLGLEGMDLVCVDDIQMVAGKPPWEQALFHLYNRLRDGGARMMVSGDRVHADLPLKLPDLGSRLAWGLGYKLQPLGDTDKIQVLIGNAKGRGMVLSVETARYILEHTARDMGSLVAILEKLDLASLAAGRKLTIPFVRTLLGNI
jgi:DnaA family protein